MPTRARAKSTPSSSAVPQNAAPLVPTPPSSDIGSSGALQVIESRHPIKRLLDRIFAIDVRSLALFRIGIGLVLLADLATRAMDMEAHYTDFGVMPRMALLPDVGDGPFPFCLHLANGSSFFQALLFLVAAMFAIMLVLGYRTRLATFGSWLMLLSLLERNQWITDGGDAVLRMMLFWSLFLPLGACWSLDAVKQGFDSASRSAPFRVLSFGTVGALLQLCFVYWFTYLLKTGPEWRVDGTAVYQAFRLGPFATPLATFLTGYPDLLRLGTFAALAMELYGPLVALMPIGKGAVRGFVTLLFIELHLFGFGLVLELGLFPIVCAVAWFLFLPTWFWEVSLPRQEAALSRSRAGAFWMRGKASANKLFTWLAALPLRPAEHPKTRANWASQTLATLSLVFVLAWNVRGLETVQLPSWANEPMVFIVRFVPLYQHWDMFAPAPLKSSGWYVIPATLQNGTVVDLYTDGRPVSWEKPSIVSATYRDSRWRKYLINLQYGKNAPQRLQYARYIARLWNRRHTGGERLKEFDIYMVREHPESGLPPGKADRILLWHHVLGDT